MSIFEHSRSKIFNQAQHPFKHGIDDFAYNNPAVGGNVTNLQQALDWVFAVLYPNQKAAVANFAALPSVGNSLGDMRVVNDDGDGKSASYQWQQREGDATPKWYKIYDVDFSTDSILAAWNDVTQDKYVVRYGRDDTDETGAVIAGTLAGQRIWGGVSANTNLTLFANSGDGVGPSTGYIQFGDNIRPVTDDDYTLGTATHKFQNFYTYMAEIADFQIVDDRIISSSGVVDFDDGDIATTGFITASHVSALTASSAFADGTTIADITFDDGSIISASNIIDFGTNALVTSGNAQIADLNFVDNVISSDTTIIEFNANDLVDINDIQAVSAALGSAVIGGATHNLTINSVGDLSHTSTLGLTAVTDITLAAPDIFVQGDLSASADITAVGRITGAEFEATGAGTSLLIGTSGNNILATGGALGLGSALGTILTGPHFAPATPGGADLGIVGQEFNDLYLNGEIILDSGNAITQGVLDSLRNVISGTPADGDTLFYDVITQSWIPSHPDSEIDHAELSGLATDSHTQYLAKDGRAGGQVAFGGTGAGENLVLASTTNASKGLVYWRDVLAPETDGTNLGALTKQIGDSYHKGQAIGLRAENTTTVTLPAASAAKIGRLVFDQTAKTLLVDDGGVWRRCGAEKSITVDASGWNGSVSTITYTVSGSMTDATKAIWEFTKTSNGDRLYPTITKTTTQVTVTFKVAIPSASYTLTGVA